MRKWVLILIAVVLCGGCMSGAIIYTPDTGDDWTTAWEQAEYTRKGKMGLSLTNYDNTSLPAIASGSWAEVAGSIYKWISEEAISGSLSSDVINYIKLVPSGSGDTAIVTATWTDSTPTWSDAYQGYYSGTSRYVGGCYYDGADYIRKWIYRNIDTGPKEEYLMVSNVGDCNDPANESTAGSICSFYSGHASGSIWLPIYDIEKYDIVTELMSYCIIFDGNTVACYLKMAAYNSSAEQTMAQTSNIAVGEFTDTTITYPVLDTDNRKYWIELYRATHASRVDIAAVRIKRIRIYR
jgi:hypothetical protein